MIVFSLTARWVASRFGLPSPTVSPVRAYTNDVFLVSSGAERFVLKVYGAGWRTEAEIRWECDLLRWLCERGGIVSVPIPGVDGDQLQRIDIGGPRQAVLFEHAAGHKPQPPFTPAMYRRQGETAATIHSLADGFASRHERPPLDLACVIGQPLTTIAALTCNSDAVDEIAEIGERIRAAMTPMIATGLDWGPCHGDLTFDNVHIADDGRTTLFDFDSGGPGWRAIDLQGWAPLVPGRDEDWRVFLDGYRSVRPPGEADLAAAPLLALANDIRGVQIELERRVAAQGADAIRAYLRTASAALCEKAGAAGLTG